jgi:hypothetical protein
MKNPPPRRVIFLGSFRVWLAASNASFPVFRKRAPLGGPTHLIAKDEPLIEVDITLTFEDEGAWVIRARTLNEALIGADDCALSAAIDGDSSEVYACLKERTSDLWPIVAMTTLSV